MPPASRHAGRVLEFEISSGEASEAAGAVHSLLASRMHLRSRGVDLVAPPPGGMRRGEEISKNEFDIDLERGVASPGRCAPPVVVVVVVVVVVHHRPVAGSRGRSILGRVRSML